MPCVLPTSRAWRCHPNDRRGNRYEPNPRYRAEVESVVDGGLSFNVSQPHSDRRRRRTAAFRVSDRRSCSAGRLRCVGRRRYYFGVNKIRSTDSRPTIIIPQILSLTVSRPVCYYYYYYYVEVEALSSRRVCYTSYRRADITGEISL